MHSAFLNMGDEKMSKSLGNVFTAREVLASLDAVQGGEQLRFFLLRGHYRSELAFTRELLEDAGNTLRGFYTALREVPPREGEADWSHPLAARFRDAMNDDFDTPVAFAVLHELRGEVNRTRSPALAGLLKALGGTIGFLQADPEAFLKGGVSTGDGKGVPRSTSTRSSRSARRRRRRGTSPAPTRSARSSTRRASSWRTSRAAPPSGARSEVKRARRSPGPSRPRRGEPQRTNFRLCEMIVRSTKVDPLWLSGP